MRVGIVGSRGYTNLARVREYVAGLPADAVVNSGGARGVDAWAVKHARSYGLEVKEFLPDTTKHPVFALAAKARNKEIVEASDQIVAFWDGDSPGTANTVTWAVALGKRVTVILP